MKKIYFSLFLLLFGYLSFAIAPITGPSTLCIGTAITLTDTTPAGIWSSSNPAVAPISTTGVVTGIAAGTTTIRYTVGGPYVSVNITVNALPSPITGPGSVCIGSPITLIDAVPGGIWTSSGPATAYVGSSTGVVTGVTPGTTIIQYFLPTGCTVSRSVTVTACTPCSGTPSPGFAGDSTACSGTTLILPGATMALGISYLWQRSGDGTMWTDIPGATTVPYIYTGATGIFFRCQTSCSYSGLSAFSTPIYIPAVAAVFHTVIYTPDTICSGLHLNLNTCSFSSTYTVNTYYGDGTSDITPLTTTAPCHADIFHDYSLPGTYLIKHYLYDGGILIDSLHTSFDYHYCYTLPVKYYYDTNYDCLFDSGDYILNQPVTTEVDSNGIPVDTISTTSGFYYQASGPVGTIYGFRILTLPSGLYAGCPTTGIFYDTIQSGNVYYPIRYFGMYCMPSAFDLTLNTSKICGRHMSTGSIVISNPYCTPEVSTVTMTFSPKYNYTNAYPPPATVIGNTAVWYFGGINSTFSQSINFQFNVPGAWLTPGDTINSYFQVTPITGDVNPSNNIVIRNDTVKSSYDPNFIEVNPSGTIVSGTQLQYSIHFENTGNDTAHNVYVMDTLSDYLIPASLNMVVASSVMNVYRFMAGGHTIIKFDFPGINLLDSSHYNLCDGMLTYTINSLPGLAGGTTILNHAGIFFDDNSVVLTDTAVNVIGTPSLNSKQLTRNEVALYPNPATNELTLTMNNTIYNSYTINNQVGQVLGSGSINGAQSKIDIHKLPSGMYMITLKGDSDNKVMKFVKM